MDKMVEMGYGVRFHPDHYGIMNPIVGMRFHLRGHNYDLCQAEYEKLSTAEKVQYEAIPIPCKYLDHLRRCEYHDVEATVDKILRSCPKTVDDILQMLSRHHELVCERAADLINSL